jgi:hypothetical protein
VQFSVIVWLELFHPAPQPERVVVGVAKANPEIVIISNAKSTL